MHATHVLEVAENDTPRFEGFHVLHEFRNVFPNRIPGLPPKRDINFTFELGPGTTLVSQTPCRMSIREILELNMQLQELLENKYIKPSVSP